MKATALKIDKGIPLPETRGAGGQGTYAATIKKMNVGDSFVAQEKLRNGVSGLAKSLGVILTVRKIKDGEIRVWLVSKTRIPEA